MRLKLNPTARRYNLVGVTRRQHRHESVPVGQKAVTVQGGYGVVFAIRVQVLLKHYACRGTSLIGAGKLSRYRMFVRGTGAVSRYKLSRSQKSVTVQDLNCGQVRVSGCKFWQDLSWEQGLAKTMTSPLIIPSVLALVILFFPFNISGYPLSQNNSSLSLSH